MTSGIEPKLTPAASLLRAALRCPACGGTFQGEGGSLRCHACHELYPVEEGVPVLLTVARRQALQALELQGHLSGGWGGHPLLRKIEDRSPLLGRFARWVYPPAPTISVITPSTYRAIASALCAPGDAAPIINVGSGRETGVGRRLWKYVGPAAPVVDMDLAPFPGVDLVADGGALPLASGSTQGVVLQNVLEHVPDPAGIVAEAHRVLRPGGYLYIEVPFVQGFHADPYDYQRFTLEGLQHLLREFDPVMSGVSVGPFSSLCWLVRELACLPFPVKPVRLAVRFGVSWLVAPLRYLDWLAVRTTYARRVACEIYALAQKRA